MLNLLISIIGETYERISAIKVKSHIYQKVSIISEFDKVLT